MWANIKNFFFPKTLNQQVQDAWHAGMREGRSQVREFAQRTEGRRS